MAFEKATWVILLRNWAETLTKIKKKKKCRYFSIHDVHGFQNLDLCSVNRLASNKIKFESYCYYYCLKRKGRGKEAFSRF